jgi:hypothetical protein
MFRQGKRKVDMAEKEEDGGRRHGRLGDRPAVADETPDAGRMAAKKEQAGTGSAASSRTIPKAEALRLARQIMDENREVLEALAR